MQSVISIVGRPNVGKSTLFNFLTGKRDALVVDQPGVTRDRQYGFGHYQGSKFIVIDTGGLQPHTKNTDTISDLMHAQSLQAIDESNALIWLVDGRDGLTVDDQHLTKTLRRLCPHIFLSVNKTEGLDADVVLSDFYGFGFKGPYAISAKRGSGIKQLLGDIFQQLPSSSTDLSSPTNSVRITVLGRPNVGKSTLTNKILGEQRMITSDQPGTTRSSIAIPFELNGSAYTLIDTAGVRRRAKIKDVVEKFSVIQALKLSADSQMIILMLNAQDTITEQDATLLGVVAASGKGLIVAINKWDGVSATEQKRIKAQLEIKMGFIDYALVHFISALHGSGVNGLFGSIKAIAKSLTATPKTSQITEILQQAVTEHAPPSVSGRRIKLRYAHIGGRDPIHVIVHGNQVDKLPESYKRYLAKRMRQRLNLVGTPVLIDVKKNPNPYKN